MCERDGGAEGSREVGTGRPKRGRERGRPERAIGLIQTAVFLESA